MRVVLSALVIAAVPAMAFAHGHGGFPLPLPFPIPLPIWPGSPAPAPELAAGLPAAVAAIGAVVATRFARRR